ncbi:MAG: hypothetical protein C5B57_11875 [Blastocatellia bacterium]|nr:MAG: hypothetical protein C5B57_11875 [Blastocatellia bacterium]
MLCRTIGRLGVTLALCSGVLAAQQLPSEPSRQFGAGITGAFEGWFDNPDGSRSFLVGYFNRNSQQALDIPIGPDNRIEPGGPDLGQPTHFLPGRQHGMFVVAVPKDFTPDKRLTWTLSVNGQATSIPLRLNPDYVVSPFVDGAVKNTPPVLRFTQNGAPFQGPTSVLEKATAVTAPSSMPLPLTVWVKDDAKFTTGTNAPLRAGRPPVTLTWSKYRGPGTVTFEKDKPELEKLQDTDAPFSGKSVTTARFSEPGTYVLHVTANDYSGPGGGGFQCCWTTALMKVTVTP